MRYWLCLAVLAGCKDRPFALDPDGATMSVSDASVSTDLPPPVKPCHLVAAGAPVETIHEPDPRSAWHSDGLLAVGRHVVHYGTVALRFGGFQDDAIRAREYDVSVWPPVAVAAETELAASVHSPVRLFVEAPDIVGAVWYTDHDGAGPTGLQYRRITPGTWALTPESYVSPDHGPVAWAVPFTGGDRFVLGSSPMTVPPSVVLEVFDRDGQRLQQLPMPELSGLDNYVSLERTVDQMLMIAAPPECKADMGCQGTSIDLYRLDGGTASTPLTATKVTSVPAPISNTYVYAPSILTDHLSHHFVIWWELTDNRRSALFAQPITADGALAGPVESWFSTTQTVSVANAAPSVGPLGVVIPVAIFVTHDQGMQREIHLLQRQLDSTEPLTDQVITTQLTTFSLSTVQLDSPRALFLGYSDYFPAPTFGGTGLLAKYVCSED